MIDYIYRRQDGGETYCYGTICEDSNFIICCENEYDDGTWTDNENLKSWAKIAEYLEANYNSKIEQIEAC